MLHKSKILYLIISDALSWGSVDMQTVAASLIELCQQARNLFLQEPRLIRLNTPTYILGDIHGNFSDLICFEKVLWRMGKAYQITF